MTLYEILRQRKADIKARLALIDQLNVENKSKLNYKRIGF